MAARLAFEVATSFSRTDETPKEVHTERLILFFSHPNVFAFPPRVKASNLTEIHGISLSMLWIYLGPVIHTIQLRDVSSFSDILGWDEGIVTPKRLAHFYFSRCPF